MWFKTATRRLEERLSQFLGAVMVTVGTGLVGVDWEPPLEARCIEAEVSIDLLGRVRAVEDLKSHYFDESQMNFSKNI